MIMLTEFKKYIEKHNLIEKGDKVLLALSGGVDSMVLAKLLIFLRRSQRSTVNSQQTPVSHSPLPFLSPLPFPSQLQSPSPNSRPQFTLAFAHCNFHLRGEDSNRDEMFVTEFAKENNIELFVKHFDTEAYAKEYSLSIEMAARELRYSWFEELKNTYDINKVALAHHGDDQIETFFINFLRGSGIKGLKGMKPQNGFYIRPLLWSNRSQIETYAKENGIKWVEDYTNKETIYLRNKIRHQIIPLFDKVKINARHSLNFSINCLSSENDLYRSLVDEKLLDIEFVKDDYRYIESKYFLRNENGKQLLFEWVRKYGFNYEQAESMFEAMTLGKSGVIFYPSDVNGQRSTVNGLIASVQKDRIEIFKNRVEEEEFIIFSEPQSLRVSESQSLRVSSFAKDENFNLMRDSSKGAQFDMDKIKFPLKLRHWKQGDRFKPLGMKGSKLLSDFFNDLGFSAYQKQNVWIMEDANGLIVWVVGYRISDKVRILDSTKVIFQCNLER